MDPMQEARMFKMRIRMIVDSISNPYIVFSIIVNINYHLRVLKRINESSIPKSSLRIYESSLNIHSTIKDNFIFIHIL